MGFIVSLSPDTATASTPGQTALPKKRCLPFGSNQPGSIAFRSCRSSRLQRLAPQQIPSPKRGDPWRLAGLLHPAAGRGVRHVSSASLPCGSVDLAVVTVFDRSRRSCRAILDGVDPSKRFPPRQPPYRHHHPPKKTVFTDRSYLLVVGLRAPSDSHVMACAVTGASAAASGTSTSRLCSTEESVVSRDVAVRRHPMLPWAFDANDVPPRTRARHRLPAGVLRAWRRTGHPVPSAFAIHVKERVSFTEVAETMPSR